MSSSVEFEKNNLRRLYRERNIALMTDFASALFSMISRNRGGRHSIVTDNTRNVNNRIAAVQNRLLQLQRDYNGKMAYNAFKKRNEADDAATVKANVPGRFAKVATVKPGLVKPAPLRLLSSLGVRNINK